MKNIDFKKEILPHIVSILVFVLINVVFYSPVFFENKGINQHDILQSRGAAKEIKDFQDETGEPGLWSNSMFGGMPSYLIGFQYSGDMVNHLITASSLGLPHPAKINAAAMICFYILLLAFGVRPYLAMAGAIAYSLCTFNLVSIEAGHNAKVLAIAYMPLVLAGIHLAFRKNWIWGFTLTALGMALQFRVNHLQITYYLFLIVAAYGISGLFNAYKEKAIASFFKTVLILVLAVTLGILSNLGRIWGVYEYSQYSTRGKSDLTQQESSGSGLDRDYVFSYSNGVFEPLTLLIPNFYGGASVQELSNDSEVAKVMRRNNVPRTQIAQQLKRIPTYYGEQPFTAGPIYAGAIIVFLFVLALITVEKKYKVWMLSIFIFGIFLSMGKNFSSFNDLMFDFFPGYSKFRSVTMTMVMPLFVMPLLGFIGLEKLFAGDISKDKKNLLIAFGITAGFSLLVFIFAGMGSFRGQADTQLPDWFVNALKKDRAGILRSDAIRSFFFILVAAASIWFYIQNKLKANTAILLLGFFILVDLWIIDKRYVNEENFTRNPERAYFSPTEADNAILQSNPQKSRVLYLPNPWNESRTSYYHHSIGGYHGAKMGRYQELITAVLSNEVNAAIGNMQNASLDFGDLHGLNMLDTRYFIAGAQANAAIPNRNALGKAWLVSRVEKVDGADAELAAITSTNTARAAVIDQTRFNTSQESYNPSGQVSLTSYSPNELKYTAKLDGKSLAVFSEIFYPVGWEATVDGERVDILRVNYVLRALELEPGEHEIVFTFQPPSYYVGNTIMLIFSSLLILVLLGSVGYSFKKLNSKTEEQ